jgi:ATP-dependent helicase IRC3
LAEYDRRVRKEVRTFLPRRRLKKEDTLQLRPYQNEALSAVVENYKQGVRKQMVVLATGLGKTVIAAQLPTVMKGVAPGKLLFIAHRNELLTQAVDKLQLWNPTLKVGLEKAENHADVDCDIIVASSASIGRANSTRMDHFWNDISVIVVDEVHHALGDSYLNILQASGVLLPESIKLLVGLTATPKRRDRVVAEEAISLKTIFDKIVYNFPIRRGIKEGFLSPLIGYRIGTKTDLSEVKTTAGDFQLDQLSNAVNTEERNAQVVKAWKENTPGRSTLCFTVDIKHAQDLAEVFRRNGVESQPVWGVDPQRVEKLRDFDSGKTTVLCNCALLTEGFDSPRVSCIVLARPTNSGTLYTQMVGRGTRLNEGKQNCAVIDVVDTYKKCSLVTLPTLVGLSPNLDLHGESVTVAAEKMEALQEKYPTIPLSHLTDLSKVEAYIESVDLFAEPYPEEVKENSDLSWVRAADDSYVLPIPERRELSEAKAYARYLHEKLHLIQNELDEYELSITSVNDNRKLGTFSTLKEAFKEADDVIRRCRADRLKLMQREGLWMENPATEAAKKYLRTLSKNRPLLKCLCAGPKVLGVQCSVCRLSPISAGEASTAINILKNTKRK